MVNGGTQRTVVTPALKQRIVSVEYTCTSNINKIVSKSFSDSYKKKLFVQPQRFAAFHITYMKGIMQT